MDDKVIQRGKTLISVSNLFESLSSRSYIIQ